MAKSKKVNEETPVPVVPEYDAPFINQDAESAMIAFHRLGYVDGISSAKKGSTYSLIVANNSGDLGLTMSDEIFKRKIYR